MAGDEARIVDGVGGVLGGAVGGAAVGAPLGAASGVVVCCSQQRKSWVLRPVCVHDVGYGGVKQGVDELILEEDF